MKTLLQTLIILAFSASILSPVLAATDNDRYGETRWNKLPLRGALSKTPWVGSWWAYKRDGSAYRIHDNSVDGFAEYADQWDRWDSREVADLSPAEKYDYYVGRTENIEYEGIIERAKSVYEADQTVSDLMTERRTLIRKLNKAIEENRDNADFKWKETEDGIRYLEVKDLIEEKQAATEAGEITVDTAFEYELLSHGTLQFGVGAWYGHCNAWAAAAIMEPEPRVDTEVNGIPFTAADLKAYLTELYMEIQSTFYGSRNDYHEDEDARSAIDFKDVTPATFHINFADRIGNKDQGFVIDRHTGSEVWNQPVRAFRSKAEALYETVDGEAQPAEREIVYTEYGYNGAELDERGAKTVYPVLVTTTIHWMSDGVPAATLTDDSINDEIDDEQFADAFGIRTLWHDQVEVRTLTYELWLDRPMDDPEARIIGDGAWQHGSATGFTQLHPDFIWVPLADMNSQRDYENEFFDYDTVVDELLPGTLEANQVAEPTGYSAQGPVAIPDDKPSEPASLSVEVTEDIEITGLTVDIEVTHTYRSDLRVALQSPDGTLVELRSEGQGGSADNLNESYDTHDFDGKSSLGSWTLQVSDHAGIDTGTLNAFTLHVR
jgi:hypothetical protein